MVGGKEVEIKDVFILKSSCFCSIKVTVLSIFYNMPPPFTKKCNTSFDQTNPTYFLLGLILPRKVNDNTKKDNRDKELEESDPGAGC